MIENLLEYQKQDGQLAKIKEKLKTIRKENQDKLIQLEEQANAHKKIFDKLVDTFRKGSNLIKSLTNSDLNSLNNDELEKMVAKCEKTEKDLEIIETKIKECSSKINEIVENYKKVRNNIIKAGKEIKKIDGVELTNDTKKTEIDEIKSEMIEFEKKHTAMVKKYKELKERINPVVVKLNKESCSYCSLKLTEKEIGEIKQNKYTICSECHRIVIR